MSTTSSRGLFLALEGAEGSGKSTQVRLLGEWLGERGILAHLCREPGGTELGEAIRAIVLGGGEIPARAELLLMLASRATFVDEVIAPHLADGAVVVADRYELSTFAYQGYGRGLPLDEVRRLNRFATGGLAPDLTIVLDLPVEEGEARRIAEGRRPDRIESAGTDFHRRVAEAYRLLADSEPGVVSVDGMGDPAQVHERIVELLQRRFPETFAGASG